MRVAIKNIDGVKSVDVSLSKGTAVILFDDGNHVRYEQLLSAILKNGFVVKGTKIIAVGTLENTANGSAVRVSGSNEVFRLVPANVGASATTPAGTSVEVAGEIPESGKGQKPDTVRYDEIRSTK